MKFRAIKTSGGLIPAMPVDVDALEKLADGEVYQVDAKPESQRTTDQNSLMWAALTELSLKRTWHGKRLSPASWKTLITASMDEVLTVPSIGGGRFVVIGKSTSNMSKKQLGDVIDMIHFLIDSDEGL